MNMPEQLIANLTTKDNKYACAYADRIVSESQETDKWYAYFDDFATLLEHPNSLVRNRALCILAANIQCDEGVVFKAFFPPFYPTLQVKNPLHPDNVSKIWCRLV